MKTLVFLFCFFTSLNSVAGDCIDPTKAMMNHIQWLQKHNNVGLHLKKVCGDQTKLQIINIKNAHQFQKKTPQKVGEVIITYDEVMTGCKKPNLNKTRTFVSVFKPRHENCELAHAWDSLLR